MLCWNVRNKKTPTLQSLLEKNKIYLIHDGSDFPFKPI